MKLKKGGFTYDGSKRLQENFTRIANWIFGGGGSDKGHAGGVIDRADAGGGGSKGRGTEGQAQQGKEDQLFRVSGEAGTDVYL